MSREGMMSLNQIQKPVEEQISVKKNKLGTKMSGVAFS
jgi:hypothetical protein